MAALNLFKLIFVLLSISLKHTNSNKCPDISEMLGDYKVIPDVLDKAPEQCVHIFYEENEVKLGNELTPTNVKDPPLVKFNTDGDALFTLCMIDPDAPRRSDPILKEWQHWMVVNIPGDQIDLGEHIIEYMPPTPPKGTGLHRYVFMIYRQPGRIDCDEPRIKKSSSKNRGKFNHKKFAKKYNLSLWAVNFFQAEWDSQVPVLLNTIGSH